MVRPHLSLSGEGSFVRGCDSGHDHHCACSVQDMPSLFWDGEGPANFTPAEKAQWEGEMRAMIEWHISFPCIIMWVVFNEGWGQYETERIVEFAQVQSEILYFLSMHFASILAVLPNLIVRYLLPPIMRLWLVTVGAFAKGPGGPGAVLPPLELTGACSLQIVCKSAGQGIRGRC